MDLNFAFDPPFLNAAGCLGFAPDPHGPVDLKQFCAFITNPVSLRARTPAHHRACRAFPGGFLLHSGYPNPGLRRVLNRYASRWARAPLPVLVHLLADEPSEIETMVMQVEGFENVAGVEISLPPEVDPAAVQPYIEAGLGEVPIIVRLPLDRALDLAPAVLAASFGVAAISLGPPRGALPVESGGALRGRLYGPASFPMVFAAVQSLVGRGLPVIAAGGVHTRSQADALLSAGAQAVQFDTILWRGGLVEA